MLTIWVDTLSSVSFGMDRRVMLEMPAALYVVHARFFAPSSPIVENAAIPPPRECPVTDMCVSGNTLRTADSTSAPYVYCTGVPPPP